MLNIIRQGFFFALTPRGTLEIAQQKRYIWVTDKKLPKKICCHHRGIKKGDYLSKIVIFTIIGYFGMVKRQCLFKVRF